MTQVQVQTSKPQIQKRTVEDVLEIELDGSVLDNAVELVTAIAYKFYNTEIVKRNLLSDVLMANFNMIADGTYAEAEIILRNGLRLYAWINIIDGERQRIEHKFYIDSLHSTDCDCVCESR